VENSLLHYGFQHRGHGTGWGQTLICVFPEAKVDLVMADTRISRAIPARRQGQEPTLAITHSPQEAVAHRLRRLPAPCAGGAGFDEPLRAYRSHAHTLTGLALTTNETVIDKFELKNSTVSAAKYLAGVPEEKLKLSSDAIASLMAELASCATNSSQVMFTIPRGTLRQIFAAG